jgi:P27 family predicted phage terminase small subunit
MPMPRKNLDEHLLAGTKPQWSDVSCADDKPSRPRYPKGLTKEAKKVFRAIALLLERRRSLTEADGELIRLLALTHVRHARAIEKLAAEGEIRVYIRLDARGEQAEVEKENLWLQIARDAEKQMIGIYDRLGFTPRDRGKVKQVNPKVPQEPEDFQSKAETTLPGEEISLADIDETAVRNGQQ